LKTTNCSTVELIDSMGTDLTVVNAARVSFDKASFWKEYEENNLFEQDEKLINYLAKHNHWSPFAHTSIQLRVSAPVFVSRQLVKHQVGGVWNEVSRRYVDDEPTFYFPNKWRKRAENVKQGSSDEAITEVIDTTFSCIGYTEDNTPFIYKETSLDSLALDIVGQALETYNAFIRNGVAPEQARMILPQNMMTSWYWTGSLMFFYRVWAQRSDSHAQMETQEVAKQICGICEELFPVSWKALVNGKV
jgi:thymidylate synthase (FAD)